MREGSWAIVTKRLEDWHAIMALLFTNGPILSSERKISTQRQINAKPMEYLYIIGLHKRATRDKSCIV